MQEVLSFFEDSIATTDVKVARSGSGTSVTEVQKLSVTSNEPVPDTSLGYFRMRFGDEESACLKYHSTADEVLAALESMNAVAAGHIRVTRTGGAAAADGYGYVFTFEFKGPKEGGTSTLLGDVEELQIVSMGSAGGCNDVSGGAPSYSMMTTRQGVPSYTYTVYFVGSQLADLPRLEVSEEAESDHSTACTGFIHSAGSVRDVKVHQVTEGSSGEVQTLTVSASDAGASGGLFKLTAAAFGIAKKQEFVAQVSDTMTSTHERADGHRVYVTSDDVLPAGMDGSVEYYVKNSASTTLELSAVSASGATVDIQSLGRGTLTMVTKIPFRAHVNTVVTLNDGSITNHNMADGTEVYVMKESGSDTLPSNLADGRWGETTGPYQSYFVHSGNAQDFKLEIGRASCRERV